MLRNGVGTVVKRAQTLILEENSSNNIAKPKHTTSDIYMSNYLSNRPVVNGIVTGENTETIQYT